MFTNRLSLAARGAVLLLAPISIHAQITGAAPQEHRVEAVWFDQDEDGLLDLYTFGGGAGAADVLFWNQGPAGFLDVTEVVGLQGNRSVSVHPGDHDGDGDQDLLLVNSSGALRLWEAFGRGFREATEAAGLSGFEGVTHVAAIDHDRDGREDFWVESGGRHPVLLRNEGGLTFTSVDIEGTRAGVVPGVIETGIGVEKRLSPNGLDEAAPASAPVEGAARLDPQPQADAVQTGSRRAVSTNTAGPVEIAGGSPTVEELRASALCARTLRDAEIPSRCLEASSQPKLGRLYTLSRNLFVDPAGQVGLGTTSPKANFHVVGTSQFDSSAEVYGTIDLFDSLSRRTIQLQPEGGSGGVLRMYNDSGVETFNFDADVNQAGFIQLRNGTSGLSRLELDGGTFDGGADILMRAGDGSIGVFLDADADNTGGLVALRNDAGVDTIRMTGDSGATNQPGENSGRIAIYDRVDNVERIVLNARQDQFGNGGQLLMRADNGVTTVQLDSDGSVGPILRLFENDGSQMLHVGGNLMTLYDSAGAATVSWNRQTGAKSAVVRTQSHGDRLLYVQEAPEVWFEDFGTARLEQGVTSVRLDPIYLETVTIDERHPMKVFVTLTEEGPGVFVEKREDHFVVRERGGGHGGASFDWRVVAKRRGHEEERFGMAPSSVPGESGAR